MPEASAKDLEGMLLEEAEDTTRLSERLQQWRRRCVYGPRELTTTAAAAAAAAAVAAAAEKDGPEDSEKTMEASEEDDE